jgi:hypothetical protein
MYWISILFTQILLKGHTFDLKLYHVLLSNTKLPLSVIYSAFLIAKDFILDSPQHSSGHQAADQRASPLKFNFQVKSKSNEI